MNTATEAFKAAFARFDGKRGYPAITKKNALQGIINSFIKKKKKNAESPQVTFEEFTTLLNRIEAVLNS